MVSFHQTEQGVQDAIAEAIAATVHSRPAGPDKLKEGHDCRPGNLAALVLPSHGPSQEARRLTYSKEILSSVFRGQELMHADGFAVGVHTGLERGLGWKGAAFNLLAYSMTVGIFNLPRCAAVLGFVPFVFLVFAFQYMTWFTGMAYARLQRRYPGIHSVPDAVHLIYGETGRTIMAAFQLLFSIMLAGNHIILGSYAFHTLGWHSCAVVLNVVFTVISFFCSLPRSYRLFANLAFLSAISVTTCMIVVCVAASTHGPNHLLPNTKPKQLLAFGPLSADDAGFSPVVLAITNVFFSFGAQPSYFPLMGEMRYPQHFPRALLLLIIFQTAVYLVMTGVVLHSLGEYVTSPIVASLSPETQRLCYMLALPAFIISGCSSGQVSAKQLYVVALRRMPWIKMRTSSTWFAWVLINALTWTSAWILAELVPFFGSFMAVESSLVWVIYIALGSVFALFLNMDRLTHAWPDRIETAGALLLVVFCVFLSVAGLWSAVAAIIHSYTHGDVDYPFSCAVSAG